MICWLALRMPTKGVDDNLKSTRECWDFYVNQPPVPIIETIPPSEEIVQVVHVRTSPGIVFEP